MKFSTLLSNVMQLEKRQHELIGSCRDLSNEEAKYKEIIPLAQLIWDLHIGSGELISFKVAVNEAAQIYGLTPSAAALLLSILYQTIIRKVNWNVNCMSLVFRNMPLMNSYLVIAKL
jgi:hypothetical protein